MASSADKGVVANTIAAHPRIEEREGEHHSHIASGSRSFSCVWFSCTLIRLLLLIGQT